MLYGEIAADSQIADQGRTELPFFPNLILGFGVMLIFILCLTLWSGFLKTSAMAGDQPQQPISLLRIGHPYFWRVFFFVFVYELVCSLVASVVIVFIWLLWKADLSAPMETQYDQMTTFIDSSQRLMKILIFIIYLVLLKPLLFIPARIIVFENTVIQALAAMRQYRLREIGRIFIAAVGGFAIVIGVMLVSLLAPEKSVMYYILSATYHLLFCAVMLFLLLPTVLWMQAHCDAERMALSQESE